MDIVRTVEHIEDISAVRWWLIALLLVVSTAFPWLLAFELLVLLIIVALEWVLPEDAGGDL